ncbi:pilus assembly protein TadG-related protein [Allobranchiibius huperziae]|uniref:Putative membrane protein n=1 Tax=Allobranchiibius huperziae TaxID=1874116 RepID=A0A853DG85_9MICO|nr:putative membrane protein [Allobranchiibius huperziae]
MRRPSAALLHRLGEERADRGRIIILCAGLFALLGLLIMGGVDVTSIQLARVHMLDAADAAALDAANAADKGAIYRGGVGSTVALSSDSVQVDARRELAAQELPAHVAGWAVVGGTGTPDGRTAVVRVSGTVHPPLFGGLLRAVGADVTITVQAKARSDVDQ